jgi:large subunit ribosomal protein L19
MSVVADFSAQCKKSVPNLKTGLTVRVHQKIQEGEKTRTQVFEGLVIRVNPGSGADATFTVRKIVDGIGVEKIFPLYSENVSKIEVKKVARVRRSKLYFMRDRQGKSANLRELRVDLSKFQAPAAESDVPGDDSGQEGEAPAEDQPAPEQTEAPAEQPETPAEPVEPTETPTEPEAPAEPAEKVEEPVETPVKEAPAPEEEKKGE